ncbi:MAG: hypothetical protein ABI912_06570 [Actinomycetota bacterium]
MTTIAIRRQGRPIDEFKQMLRHLSRGWAAGRRPFMATLATACVAAAAIAERDSAIRPVIDRLGVEQAGLPMASAILRLPASLVMSSPSLPFWGAILQVFALVAAGELLFGWRKTLVVGLLAHAAATLSARAMIAIGTGPLSLPVRYLTVRDTGPSAAVVGIAVYAMIRLRTPWTLAFAVGVLVLELFALPNLAGREHITAIIVGAVLAIVDEAVRARTARYRVEEPVGLQLPDEIRDPCAPAATHESSPG